MSKDIYIYVAGPLTVGDTFENVRQAVITGNELWEMGFTPFVPHSNIGWPLQFKKSWDDWLTYDEKWIRRCDCLFRMPGESPGAEREVAFCLENDIPVFYDYGPLLGWAKSQGWVSNI